VIANARKKWNRERCNSIAVLIQHWKRDVRDAPDLVAGHFLVTSLANPTQMPMEVSWQPLARSALPFCERAISHRALLKREDEVARGGIEKIDPRTKLEREPGGSRRVYLLDDYHFSVA
jgi:hypothetical protein